MTPIVYKLELRDQNAKDVLARITAQAKNLRGLHQNVGEHLLNSTMDNFKGEHDPDGIPWKKLMPRTIEAREKSGQTPITILRAQGRLAGSVNLVATDEDARIGTPVPYAAAHQLGAEIKKKERQQTIYQRYDAKTDTLHQKFVKKSKSNFARDVLVKEHTVTIPARPFLGAGKQDEIVIIEIAEEWLRSENPELK